MNTKISFDEAIAFIWREAEILDNGDYSTWLELWETDGLYIIPIDKTVTDHANALNYAYDNADMRRMRVARLSSTQSMSAATAATTIRTISRFVEAPAEGDVVKIRAAQHLAEYRRGKHRLVPAALEIDLRRDADGTIKYVRKVITLASSEDGIQGIAYLL